MTRRTKNEMTQLCIIVITTIITIIYVEYSFINEISFINQRASNAYDVLYKTECKNIINHKPAQGPLLIFVLSERANFAARTAIRESWARNRQHMVRFIVGNMPCNVPPSMRDPFAECKRKGLAKKSIIKSWKKTEQIVQKALDREAACNGDMVLLDDVQDTYYGLAKKTLGGMIWASEHSEAEWIGKTDDDVAVDVVGLQNVLPKVKDPFNDIWWIGKTLPRFKPHLRGRYADPFFPYDMYPQYPMDGAGYFVTRALADTLAKGRDKLKLYKNEDVAFAQWIIDLGHNASWVGSKAFCEDTDTNACFTQKSDGCVVFGHRLQASQMIKCTQKLELEKGT